MLVLLNGAPGVGKSTIARLFASDRPRTLVVEIDEIRRSLPDWQSRVDTMTEARAIAIETIRLHLSVGHTVIVPQFVMRPEFIEQLRTLAEDCATRFVAVVLTDDPAAIAERFRNRRSELREAGIIHPERDLADDAVTPTIVDATERLARGAVDRRAIVVAVSNDIESTLIAFATAIALHEIGVSEAE